MRWDTVTGSTERTFQENPTSCFPAVGKSSSFMVVSGTNTLTLPARLPADHNPIWTIGYRNWSAPSNGMRNTSGGFMTLVGTFSWFGNATSNEIAAFGTAYGSSWKPSVVDDRYVANQGLRCRLADIGSVARRGADRRVTYSTLPNGGGGIGDCRRQRAPTGEIGQSRRSRVEYEGDPTWPP